MASTAQSQESPEPQECPYCGHPITHDEFHAIEARIAEEEQSKYAEQKTALVKELGAKHLAETSELRKSLAVKSAEAKELAANAHEAGRKEAESKLANDTAVLEQARKDFDAGKEKTDAVHKAELERQREILNASREKEILQQKADTDKSNYRLTNKLKDLQRQLEQKSNEQLGDGAEVDVFNELKAAFPDDVITRVKKGTAGADIIHEVHIDGRACGKIVYDSKNRNQWRNEFAEKLRKDQLAEKAEYSILATRKFAKDVREMAQQDGVVVINPARVVIVARLLRDFIETLSRTKLSEQDKQGKRDRLYEFLTSQRCTDLFIRVEHVILKLHGIDEKELKQQQSIRKNRGSLLQEVEKTVLGEIQREIHDIIGGDIDG